MLHTATSERQFIMYEALRKGATVDQLHELTKIKVHFIQEMKELVEEEQAILAYASEHPGEQLPEDQFATAKKDGFSDRYLGQLLEHS